ncbi:MAG: endopeptidase La, partial [bacterium]|nr:endopeptidase La [bacterium]
VLMMEEENVEENIEIQALMRNVAGQFEHYVKLNKKIPVEIMMVVTGTEEPSRLADIITAHLNLTVKDKQDILEVTDTRERLEKLSLILNKEIEILGLEKKIRGRVRQQIEKIQKEYYLREQLKAIHKELGSEDEFSAEIQEYRKKITAAKMGKEAEEKALRELERLERMPYASAEVGVIKTYLDWLCDLPWTKRSRDKTDIVRSRHILDEDHYGLKNVKERILEYLAVCKLTKKIRGPILCFVGPPGVGKTSLGRSIARSLGRKFVRMSLGGVRDEAEIRGHRRTYVGALPGRIIQGVKKAGTKNPVFMLDEIDKVGADFRGDPSAALLEVLDPEQNHSFEDHYINTDFDLSDVMFITTANVLHTVPPALRDRMEVIRIPGYTEEEKVQISEKFLLPKQIDEHGLKKHRLELSRGAVVSVIRHYTQEAGVRNLERSFSSICRKTARQVVEKKSKKFSHHRVSTRSLDKLLGPPKFRHGQKEEKDEVGVATGMAWTEVGGVLLPIECVSMPGKGKLTITGQIGEVMQESARASFSYLRSHSSGFNIKPDFYKKNDFHIHVPEGAIPKDGPSAGIALVVALASMLTGRPVRRNVAMTGEITLRGKVLPVGGIKEKVLAAHRAGILEIVLCHENEKDLVDIPNHIRKKLVFKLMKNVEEALDIVLVKKNKASKSRLSKKVSGSPGTGRKGVKKKVTKK